MKITIKDVTIENVVKGKSRYSKAAVAYEYNGEARTQNIMDFANPAVFKQVQNLVGQEIDVTLTKNSQGYNEWSAINANGGTSSAAPSTQSTGATRVTGSNYETPEERARKQLYIVRQSSISNALEYFKFKGNLDAGPDEVIHLAKIFVDFVFDTTQE